MKKQWLVLAMFALMLAIAGCGSSETKTVTETVEVESQAAPESEGASGSEEEASASEAPEGATTDQPTATTIPDGTWAKGEYTPGTYRAPGGELCSWEQNQKLGGEAAGEEFNENYGIGEKNILIEINSPYFKTEDCGVWQKVG